MFFLARNQPVFLGFPFLGLPADSEWAIIGTHFTGVAVSHSLTYTHAQGLSGMCAQPSHSLCQSLRSLILWGNVSSSCLSRDFHMHRECRNLNIAQWHSLSRTQGLIPSSNFFRWRREAHVCVRTCKQGHLLHMAVASLNGTTEVYIMRGGI